MTRCQRHADLAASIRANDKFTVWLCDVCYVSVCLGLDADEVNRFPVINFLDAECGICGYAVGEYLVPGHHVLESDALGPLA